MCNKSTVSSTTFPGLEHCLTRPGDKSSLLVIQLEVSSSVSGIDVPMFPPSEHSRRVIGTLVTRLFPDGVQFCSGLVDLAVCVRRPGGGGHRRVARLPDRRVDLDRSI